MIYRAMINQPSSLQDLHSLNGKVVIVEDLGEKTVTIYFTEGVVHSMVAPRICITRIG